MPPSVRAAAPGGSSASHWRCGASRAASAPAETPACTVTVRSAGLCSITRSRPHRSTTRSARAGGLPSSSAEPEPRGMTARPASCASARMRLSCSIEPGRTTQLGQIPSIAAAASTAPSSRTPSGPAIETSASPIERPATAIAILDPRAVGHARTRRPEPLATGGVRGQELARIHDAARVEDPPEPVHEVQVGVRVLERKVLRLVQRDPVLAGHRATHGNARAQELLVRRLRALELIGYAIVVEDERVEVAIARVEDVRDLDAVTGANGKELAHDLRQSRARDYGVLQEIGRRQPADGPRGLLAPLPEERALGVVRRDTDLQGAPLPADPRGQLALRLHLGGRPV